MLQTVLLRENPFSPSSVFSTLEEQHEITVPPLPDQPVLLAFYRREDKGNLGDELSPYIVKKMTKRKII